MEYDDGGNFTNLDDDYSPSSSMHRVLHEIIFILFATVGILANIAIIYVLLRFKRMRTTENMFLVNWAIADLCSLIVTPSGYRIISILENITLSRCFMCTIFHLGTTFQVTTVFFILLIVIDWIMEAFFENISKKCRQYYKYIIGAIWIFAVLVTGFSTGYCMHEMYSIFPALTLFSSFIGLSILIFVLQCTRAVKKYYLKKPVDHSPLMLTLATSYVGCWILGVIMFIGIDFARLHPVVSVIAECTIFCISIVIIILLYRFNTDFQACLLQALRRTNNKYEDSICSFDNPIVKNSNGLITKDAIRISFHNPDEELLANEY